MIARVAHNIRDLMRSSDMRWTELGSLVASLGWALLLFLSTGLFSRSKSLTGMGQITGGSQWQWGIAFMVACVVDACSLALRTRRLRLISGMTAMALWVAVATTLTISGGIGPGSVVYGWMALVSAIITIRAAREPVS